MPAFVSIDILIIVGIFVLFILSSLKLGKSFLACFIIAFYPSYLIFTNLTNINGKDVLLKAGIFVGIFIFTYIVCGRIVATSFSFLKMTRFIQMALLSSACTSLVIFFHYHVVSLAQYHDFGASVDTLFTTTVPLIGWLAFPIVALFISSRD